MFAVIKTGGKQYRVAAEDQITVMTVAGEPGDVVTFSDVLMLVDGEAATFGAPLVAGASVAAEILSHGRGPKAISFKKRRRQNSKRKRGHRQDLTLVRITEILTGGAKASASSTLAAKSDAGQNAIASSPESASTWNSCEPVPPIEPVSAATARNCSPRRVKMRE